MASSKPLAVIALFLLVALLMVADAQPAPKIDCPSACQARSRRTGRTRCATRIATSAVTSATAYPPAPARFLALSL
ncbi:hypothetical protein ZWY2020_026007 [Hordeum vulgare]|nr:hypothetical protein ZWY2020_026007 [Hordeum vulgare]